MTILKDIYKFIFAQNHDAVWKEFSQKNIETEFTLK